MSLVATIIYEIIYAIFYFGLLFSKSTVFAYINNPSSIVKLLLLVILFSGFFVPYYLKLLNIKLIKVHYITLTALLCCSYALASRYYYKWQLTERNFHSFLQITPTEQTAAVPKPKSVYRILCLGGSTTEGEQGIVPYPKKLERMLQDKYPDKKIEIINGGKYFYTSQHDIIQYLFYLEDLEPDLIILFEAINDIFPSFVTPPFSSAPFRKDYGHYYGALAYVRYPLLFEEFLSGFFYADLFKPKLKPSAFTDFKSLPSFRQNLEMMIEITKCENTALILSNQAHCFSKTNNNDPKKMRLVEGFLVDKEHYADERSWYEAMELFNRTTQETAKKWRVPFVDQAAAFMGKSDLFIDCVHMTQEGINIKAQHFFNKIVELKLIK